MSNTGTRTLASWITASEELVVFTGAGISTESGIPDFRSPGGIWDRFDAEIMTYDNFLSSEEGRRKYWEFHRDSWTMFNKAEPNRAHLALTRLEEHAKLTAIITQNIDGLHQRSGICPEKVLELHGTMWEVGCLDCGEIHPWEQVLSRIEDGDEVPLCHSCEGLLKPGTVAFGEPLPEDVFARAYEAASSCDLFLAIGTSLTVYPAAILPEIAANTDARLAIINRDPTPLDSRADLTIHGMAGAVLSGTLEHIES